MFPVFSPEGIGVPGLVALIAVTHVFVAHFAVGGGLYLILTERWGRKANLPDVVDHARRHSRFFVLLTLVFGALSGVGIWFVIGLASPDNTFLLIRTFVWGWAAEWCFFVIELTAAIVYYKTWDRIDAKRHMTVGWIYATSSIFTLLIINGILSFMLTPGDWVENKSFWSGLINPTYLPSSILRIGLTVSIAGCFGLLTAGRSGGADSRRLLIARSARWVTIGIAIAVPCFFWMKAAFPADVMTLLDRSLDAQKGAVPLLNSMWKHGGIVFVLLFVVTLFISVAKPKRFPLPAGLCVVLLAFFGFGCGEYVREILRKPYGVRGVMYVNGVRKDDVYDLRTHGYLRTRRDAERLATASVLERGEAMYVGQCSVCHTKGGYRGLSDLMDGWDRNQIRTMLLVMHKSDIDKPTIWAAMPPLVGTKDEVDALAQWLEQFAGLSTAQRDE